MANHKSALKRNRQSIKRNERNRSNRATARTVVAKAKSAIGDKKSKDKDSLVVEAISVLNRTARKGAIHWKTAARKSSRLQKALNKANA